MFQHYHPFQRWKKVFLWSWSFIYSFHMLYAPGWLSVNWVQYFSWWWQYNWNYIQRIEVYYGSYKRQEANWCLLGYVPSLCCWVSALSVLLISCTVRLIELPLSYLKSSWIIVPRVAIEFRCGVCGYTKNARMLLTHVLGMMCPPEKGMMKLWLTSMKRLDLNF